MKRELKRLVVVGAAMGMLATSILGVSAGGKFDAKWYAEQNPDVVKELGDSEEALLQHYEMYGRKEARMSNSSDVEAQLRRLFNAEEYAKLYPDVKDFYGEDVEAMFQHYIAYGLLEARRPSEKVSQAVAVSLKKTIEKAMADAGLEAVPGSVEVVKVIMGDVEAPAADAATGVADAAEVALLQALVQVQEVVTKAITETVKAVQNPAPAAPSGGSSGGSSSSGTPGTTSTPTPSPTPTPTPAPTSTPDPEDDIVWVDVTDNDGLRRAVSDNDYVRLTDNITVTETVVIERPVTIDLNGKKVSSSTVDWIFVTKAATTIQGGGSIESTYNTGEWKGSVKTSTGHLTLDGVTVKGTEVGVLVGDGTQLTVKEDAVVEGQYAVFVDGNHTKPSSGSYNQSTVTVNKGKLVGKASGCALYVNGNRDVKDLITVIDSDIQDEGDTGIYLAGEVQAFVKGNTTVKGTCGIEIRAGELTIEDGTITGTAAFSKTSNENGSTVKGVALAVSQHSTNKKITVNVKGNAKLMTETSPMALYVTNALKSTNTSEHVSVIVDSKNNIQSGKSWGKKESNAETDKITVTVGSDTLSGNDVSANNPT